MILDTNAISAWAAGDDQVVKAFPTSHLVAFPAVALGEYLWGLRRSNRRDQLEVWLADALSSVPVLPVDADTTVFYANIRGMTESRGRRVPDNDAWIAAIAMQHQMPILSRDSDFDRIDGIQRIAW